MKDTPSCYGGECLTLYAEKKSVYSTAPVDWAIFIFDLRN